VLPAISCFTGVNDTGDKLCRGAKFSPNLRTVQ
jgi:hypothetical protein